MRRNRLLAAAILAALPSGACSGRYTAVEPWKHDPELRIFAILTPTSKQLITRVGNAPLDLPLSGPFGRHEEVTVWAFSYSLATLSHAFPGLNAMAASEVAGILNPSLDLGTGRSAPEADEVLNASVDQSGPHNVDYQSRTWADWQTAAGQLPKVSLELQLPPDLICRGITVTRFDGPDGRPLSALITLSEDQLILGGVSSVTVAAQKLRLWKMDRNGTAVALPDGDELEAPVGLTWHPIASRGYGVTSRGQVFSFDSNGRRLMVPPPPFVAGGISAGGTDSTVIAFAALTGDPRNSGFMYQLRDDAWQLLTGTERPIETVRVVRSDKIFTFARCWVQEYDGASTSERLLDPGCNLMTATRGLFLDLAADEDGAVASGKNGFLAIRDMKGQWVAQTPPEEHVDYAAAASLRKGRQLIAGKHGTVAVFLAPGWCPVDTGTPADLIAAASSPSGQTAWVLGSGQPSSVILRIDLPPQ